jgi:hypothetical protein
MKQMQFRQGDVLITKVRSIPKAATEKARDAGRIVLAYGEVTGHAHAIADETATLFSLLDDGKEELYLQADGTVTLRHEEHAPIEIPGGAWKVTRQREYSPEAIRNVAD